VRSLRAESLATGVTLIRITLIICALGCSPHRSPPPLASWHAKVLAPPVVNFLQPAGVFEHIFPPILWLIFRDLPDAIHLSKNLPNSPMPKVVSPGEVFPLFHRHSPTLQYLPYKRDCSSPLPESISSFSNECRRTFTLFPFFHLMTSDVYYFSFFFPSTTFHSRLSSLFFLRFQHYASPRAPS